SAAVPGRVRPAARGHVAYSRRLAGLTQGAPTRLGSERRYAEPSAVGRLLALSGLAVLALSACTATGPGTSPRVVSGGPAASSGASAVPPLTEPLRLVTLGDAYTAGTGTLAPKRD